MDRTGLAQSLVGGPAPQGDPIQEEAPEMEVLQQVLALVTKISDQLDDLMGEQKPEPQMPPEAQNGPGQQ